MDNLPGLSHHLGHRAVSLVRGRYLMSTIALVLIYLKPEAGQWFVAAAALSCGVSAIDSWRGNGMNSYNYNRPSTQAPQQQSQIVINETSKQNITGG